MAKKSASKSSPAKAAKRKAAKKKAKQAVPTEVTVTYDLFDLPTAQHKAGLAGLMLQIDFMRSGNHPSGKPIPPEHIPEILERNATTATIRFTEESLCGLMDDLYDASIVEVAVREKWQGQKPKREETVEEVDPKTNKVKKSKRFYYDRVEPRGHFLRTQYSEDEDLWHKLWRNMLWQIPRSKPTTRGPYNSRANAPGEPCAEGLAAWKDLLAYHKALAKNSFKTSAVSSALLLGAQAVNAERVAFLGRVEQTLLLHFWPLAVVIYVPQEIGNDGNNEFVGFSLAIPEVCDLDRFGRQYLKHIRRLPGDKRGYRPAASIIDVAEQSALEFMTDLAEIVQGTASSQLRNAGISSIEYLHLVKQGNNVKTMAAGRIAPEEIDAQVYLETASPRRSTFRNSIFRGVMLRSMLNRSEWWSGFANMLQTRPWSFFVRCADTPRKIPWIATDAARQFKHLQQAIAEDLHIRKEHPEMATHDSEDNDRLAVLIHRLVSNYVNRKTEQKSGRKWSEFKDQKVKDETTGKEKVNVPRVYTEAREKVVSDAFLAMRSRRDQDFVDYFTASICSVGQHLPQKDSADFALVAKALLGRREDVKTLTLLALSANS